MYRFIEYMIDVPNFHRANKTNILHYVEKCDPDFLDCFPGRCLENIKKQINRLLGKMGEDAAAERRREERHKSKSNRTFTCHAASTPPTMPIATTYNFTAQIPNSISTSVNSDPLANFPSTSTAMTFQEPPVQPASIEIN